MGKLSARMACVGCRWYSRVVASEQQSRKKDSDPHGDRRHVEHFAYQVSVSVDPRSEPTWASYCFLLGYLDLRKP